MKKFISVLLAGPVLAVLAGTALAFIDPGAPSASHQMEELAVEIHDYLHDNYGSTFGAHGLEEAATTLHDTLHDWGHGSVEVPESQIVEDMDALDAAWKSFKQTIRQEHILNSGDEALDIFFDMNKDAYKEIRFLLRQADKHGKKHRKHGKKHRKHGHRGRK